VLTIHHSPADVLALTVEGTVGDADLTFVMDRLEPALAAHDPLHLFVEVRGFTGLAPGALPSYAARAFPLLGQLRGFGRIAVVADQAWLRAATRVESALLPGISYRTFLPDQRAAALAWATEGVEP